MRNQEFRNATRWIIKLRDTVNVSRGFYFVDAKPHLS